jgi:nucleotide exchange factor SIL1
MDFLENGAMAQILQFLVMDMAETEAAKRKLANLVMDNFLDAGMGAILGEWPRNQTSGDDACHLDTVGANESCWEYHLRRLAREYSDYPEHWSQDLWEALQRQKRLREQDTHVRSDDF